MKLGRISGGVFTKPLNNDQIPESIQNLLAGAVFVQSSSALTAGLMVEDGKIITSVTAFKRKGDFYNLEVGFNKDRFLPLPEGLEDHDLVFMAKAEDHDSYSAVAETLLVDIIIPRNKTDDDSKEKPQTKEEIFLKHAVEKIPLENREFDEKDEILQHGNEYFVICHKKQDATDDEKEIEEFVKREYRKRPKYDFWNVYKVLIEGFEDAGTKCFADDRGSHDTGIIGGIVLTRGGKMVGMIIGHYLLGPRNDQSTFMVMPIEHVRKFFVDRKKGSLNKKQEKNQSKVS